MGLMTGMPRPLQREILTSLEATGKLPDGNSYLDRAEAKWEKNSARFEKNHTVLGALFKRDDLQERGLVCDTASLFDNTGQIAYLQWRQGLNHGRFNAHHVLLGRWLDLDRKFDNMPCTPDGVPCVPIPGMPCNPHVPTTSVPEPSTIISVVSTLVMGYAGRKVRRLLFRI